MSQIVTLPASLVEQICSIFFFGIKMSVDWVKPVLRESRRNPYGGTADWDNLKNSSEEYDGLNLFAWTMISGAKERHDIDRGIKIQNVLWKLHKPVYW